MFVDGSAVSGHDGPVKTRRIVDPHSFRIVTEMRPGSAVSSRLAIFTTGDERADEFFR